MTEASDAKNRLAAALAAVNGRCYVRALKRREVIGVIRPARDRNESLCVAGRSRPVVHLAVAGLVVVFGFGLGLVVTLDVSMAFVYAFGVASCMVGEITIFAGYYYIDRYVLRPAALAVRRADGTIVLVIGPGAGHGEKNGLPRILRQEIPTLDQCGTASEFDALMDAWASSAHDMHTEAGEVLVLSADEATALIS